jgi:hypothetical protein
VVSRFREGLTAALVTAAVTTGCHDVDEFGSEGSFGVTILDTSDLGVVGTIPGFPGGRSICSLDQTRFLVASNTGLLYTVSSQDMAVVDVAEIGSPFGAGYCDMVLATGGNAYVIGGFGQLIEYDPDIHTVVDEFTAGPSPVSLCRSLTQNRIYVGDAQDMKVRELSTADNTITRELELSGAPTTLSTFIEASNLILAASSGAQAAYVIQTEGYFGYWEAAMPGLSSGITGLPDTSVYCVAQPEWTGENGTVTLIRGSAVPDETQVLDLSGHPASVCCDPVGHDFYVASYLGEGSTRVYKIDGYTWDIVGTVDIPGYPWDTAVHANGAYLLVMTLD